MAIAASRPATALLTYEEYLAEGHIEGRYEIVEGVRGFMPGASWRHQRIADNITGLLRQYEETSGEGLALSAPFDVLIRSVPKLQTRQPDVLFISHIRLAQRGGVPDRGVLETAPELIVEVVSDTETQRDVEDKLSDYGSIGVEEAWIVRPVQRTVELLKLTPHGSVSVAVYSETQPLQSLIFPRLVLSVEAVFKL